jgi:ABC-type transport system involved in cytochrome bd biosynthesis fused ATPase/permease subunit
MNFNIGKNKLIAVVGPIGSGKSSLLSAILGEMHKFNGNINIVGKIAYAPQIAWIQNATIKENILFGDNFDKDNYRKCIEACALSDDLNLFDSKDDTEIGEKVKQNKNIMNLEISNHQYILRVLIYQVDKNQE